MIEFVPFLNVKILNFQYLNSSSSSLLVDEMPPEQLLADDDTASDFDLEDILDIKEEDFDSLPFLKAYNVEEEVAEDLDIDVNKQSSQEQRIAAIHGQIADERTSMEEEDFDSDEGNLMIDDTRGRTLKKGKQSSRKRYTAVERIEGSKKFSREEVGKTAFMLWAKSVRSQLAKQNPGMDFVAIRKHLGEMWGKLTNSEKNEWKRRATGLTTKTRTEQRQIISPRSAGRPSSATIGSGTSLVGSSPILAAAITKPHQKQNDSGLFKVVGTEPIDVAAHLKLLGESLSTIGERLCEHEGMYVSVASNTQVHK